MPIINRLGIVVGFFVQTPVMKKGMYALTILTVLIGNLPLSFHGNRSQLSPRAFIKGTISPAEAADAVRIVAANDTLKTDIVLG